jgi:hypothetical protein
LLLEKFISCCRHAARPIVGETAVVFAQQILALENFPDCGGIFRR